MPKTMIIIYLSDEINLPALSLFSANISIGLKCGGKWQKIQINYRSKYIKHEEGT